MAAHEPNLMAFLKANAFDLSAKQIDSGIKPIIDHLMLSAPNKQSTLSDHQKFSTQYTQLRKKSREHNIDCLAAALCQKILPLAPDTSNYTKALLRFIRSDNSGIIDAEKENFFMLLYTHCAVFDLTAIGNSAHRASYAALKLKACLGNNFNIHMKNIPAYEHYVIYISKIGVNEFYTYDPLLNPELIFTIKDYKKIITHYQKDPNRWTKTQFSASLDIKITPEIVELYHQLSIKTRAVMLAEIKEGLDFDCCYEYKDLKSSLPKMKENSYTRRLQESINFLREKIKKVSPPEEDTESPKAHKNGFLFLDSWNGVPKSTMYEVTSDSTERPASP